MSLIGLIIVILVVGLIMYLINSYFPLDPPFKTILNAVIVIALLIYLLRFAGMF
jgi:hypothetical protein